MIRNHFKTTLRFNPEDLDVLKPNLEIVNVSGLRRGEPAHSVTYTYHRVKFLTTYIVSADVYHSRLASYTRQFGDPLLPGPVGTKTLLDAVKATIRLFEAEAFENYLSWLVNEAFTAPYKYRKVEVVEKDQDRRLAKVEVAGFIKAIAAFRMAQPPKRFQFRVATPSGIEAICFPSRSELGKRMRPVVTSMCR